ncbi:hypothetical protein MMC14_006962 [Varicellaria rhodocarpa]|nr:hypothetical protein [Varicellaria rhodocarpa]
MTTQSPLLENQQNRASNRLARSDYSSQGRGGRSQVIPLQGGNLRPPAQTCHVETGRPMRNLERSLRSHPAPAVLAKGCDSAKSVYDILLKWLTAEESQSTIVLLGMASITTTGLVTYLASGNICIAAIEIAKAMSVNGSSAVVGVAKVAAPALAGMGVYMYLGTQVIWGASDMIRGYVLGPSARVSRSANGYGRVLGEIDDQPTLLRSLMSPPRRSSRIRLSEPTTSQRRIGN